MPRRDVDSGELWCRRAIDAGVPQALEHLWAVLSQEQ